MSGAAEQRSLAHAESLMDLRRHAEAAAAFRDVLSRDPESVTALLGLGRALQRQGRLEEAEQAVRSALALDSERGRSHHVLVDVLVDRRDGPGAVAAAERGVRLEPHDFTSHYQHARALLAQRRPRVREAYGAALRAVDLAPHSPDAHNLVGICLDQLGDHDAAQHAFHNALAIDPQHTLAQNNLAATELDRGRLRRAAALLHTAVGVDPQERRVRDNLDVVLLVLLRRVLWSLAVVAVVLGALLAVGAPWCTRAVAGIAYVGLVGVLLQRVRSELPRGLARWGRGLWRRARWSGRYLMGLLGLVLPTVLVMALAPRPVAVAAGLALAAALRVLGGVAVLVWIGYAAGNLVRGR